MAVTWLVPLHWLAYIIEFERSFLREVFVSSSMREFGQLGLALTVVIGLLISGCGYVPFYTEPLLFGSGSVALNDPDLKVKTTSVIGTLKRDSTLKVLLLGHADSTGSSKANERLAMKRTEALAAYLAREGGIAPNRIHVLTSGSDNPIASNNSSAGRSQNRRVEFIFFRQAYGDVLMRIAPIRISLKRGVIVRVGHSELDEVFDQIETLINEARVERARVKEVTARFLKAMQMSPNTPISLAVQSLAAQSSMHVTVAIRDGKPFLAVRGAKSDVTRRVKALSAIIDAVDESAVRVAELTRTVRTLNKRAVTIPAKMSAAARSRGLILEPKPYLKVIQHNLAQLNEVALASAEISAHLAAVSLAITTSYR